jgi:hypothetical protein
MGENKTKRTTASVAAFLAAIDDPHRQRDAKTLAALMRKATGQTPAMWGSSIVGYGQTTYHGRSGTVDWFPVGFSPRKAALVVYLMGGLKANAGLLRELGPHKVGGGCLYLRRLEEIDTKVLTRLIELSHKGNRRTTKQLSARTMRDRPTPLKALAILAALALSFTPLPAQSTSGPAASILGTWHGSSTCVDRARDPACRDEDVIYEVDSAAGPAGPVRMTADKIVNGARVNMGTGPLQYDTVAHAWVEEIRGRFHGRWSFVPKRAEMTGTLVELPSGRLVRRVVAHRAS